MERLIEYNAPPLPYYGEMIRSSVSTVVKEPKIQRNEKCPCGSGKKYKKCCLILK